MQINIITKTEFYDLALNHTRLFLDKINAPEVFIIKECISPQLCAKLRDDSFQWALSENPSWHKFDNDCPDYHRLHDNYPNAHVKQKFHGFYRHNYFSKNKELFESFKELFVLKNKLAGFADEEFFHNKPSDGILPRINVHHYPKGGGYQAEHIDPNGPFAQIQLLIVASSFGKDFLTGGVFAREAVGGEKFYLDEFTGIGDMIVMSPGIPHGVDPIDKEEPYSPDTNNGRWIILPLFLHSDYPSELNVKPKQL